MTLYLSLILFLPTIAFVPREYNRGFSFVCDIGTVLNELLMNRIGSATRTCLYHAWIEYGMDITHFFLVYPLTLILVFLPDIFLRYPLTLIFFLTIVIYLLFGRLMPRNLAMYRLASALPFRNFNGFTLVFNLAIKSSISFLIS